MKCKRVISLVKKGIKSARENGVSYAINKAVSVIRTNKGYRFDDNNNIVFPAHLKGKIGDVKFSILVPLFNTPEAFLRDLIASVQKQDYSNWELCLADSSDDSHKYVEEICAEYAAKDNRIVYQRLNDNYGISGNSNACARMASGNYLALLDHDDILSRHALIANALAIADTGADVLYSDEDHLSIEGKHISPFFKPDWSPDLLHSQMYICHFLVFRKSLFEKIGGFRSEYDGSQDYDLMLRLSEETNKICHIPQVLYSWRESPTSTASNADIKPYAHEAGRKALDAHLKRVYGPHAEARDGEYTFTFDARFPIDGQPKVSIIIPMRDKWELSDQCIHSIVEKSSYPNYEILIMDNRSKEKETKEWFEKIKTYDNRVQIIPADMDFNWSAINNYGVDNSSGDVLVFLNNDTLVISEDWLERLIENTTRKEVGLVGGLLLYPDGTIQHTGVVVGIGGWADHVFKEMQPVHNTSPFVSPVLTRNTLAVTGACMAISKKHYFEIGPFDEEFIICGSDVEICIRAYEKGYFNVLDTQVKLFHLESKSRDSYIPEEDFKKSYEAYSHYRENSDPFFNVNLDIQSTVPKACAVNPNKLNYNNYKLYVRSFFEKEEKNREQ